jgi:hypothetical protein
LIEIGALPILAFSAHILSASCRDQMGAKFQRQVFRQPLEFIIQASAYMMCLALENQRRGLIHDATGKVQPHPFREGWPEGNLQDIVVTGGRLVTEGGIQSRGK